MKRVTRQEVKKALEKNPKSKSYCKCAGCRWAFKITEEERKEYAEIQCANCKSFYLFYAFAMDIDTIIDPEPEQYCITCRGCGKPESECTCNVPTIDKDTEIEKLQARIKELETLVLTKEEAETLFIYAKKLESLNNMACLLQDVVTAGAKIGDAYMNCLMKLDNNKYLKAKLQKIIDKRGCNED